jgi:polyhydroxyalkanoate synthesis regulator phasin
MPKFDRNVLAKFLPQRYIPAFEQLNTSVDTDLPNATAAAQLTADEARILAAIARTNSDVLRPLLEALTSRVLTERDSRAQIAALGRRIADLEMQVMALRRGSDIDQLRRQIADLQSYQLKR